MNWDNYFEKLNKIDKLLDKSSLKSNSKPGSVAKIRRSNKNSAKSTPNRKGKFQLRSNSKLKVIKV